MPVVPRTASGPVELNLDGKPCGFVKSVAGGDISAPVIEVRVAPAMYPGKRLGQPVCEPFAFQFGLGMSSIVYDWIATTWNATFEKKDGSVVAADFNLQARETRTFTKALLTETAFPALDASSKDAGFLTVKLLPEWIDSAASTGTLGTQPAQKKWLLSNFRLELDGIDCSKVSRIEPFAVATVTSVNVIGGDRVPTIEPSSIEFPNLTITVSEAGAQTWSDWFQDFVIKGNNEEGKEKGGAIVFLGPDMKAELARVTLHNVGICALRHPPQQSGSDQNSRLTAELYCEKMDFHVGPAAPIVKPEPVIVVPRPPIKPVIR